MHTVIAEDVGTQLFFPKDYDLIWSTVVLIILLVVFAKFVMPRLNKAMDERAKKIQGQIAEATKAKQEAEAAKKKYQDRLAQAQAEASKIRDDARTEASHILEDARTRAQVEAAAITDNAQKAIDSQKQQAMQSLKKDVGALATTLAGKIIGTQLASGTAQSSMIDSLIEEMEKENAASGQSGNGSH